MSFPVNVEDDSNDDDADYDALLAHTIVHTAEPLSY